ncbi:hypothetical protein CTAYLR_001092 [Chrysophaeum taylorii]|uniref:Cyclic nucleotide-binding domain-containing protein n=1 Tax=Chrysophaeum taylorii TaxID=2483200 RepID=A0AAD7UNZ4_9STRA|nr:hypothetical protein CTAYLR_001092 [Chrysophaeum taylorii]
MERKESDEDQMEAHLSTYVQPWWWRGMLSSPTPSGRTWSERRQQKVNRWSVDQDARWRVAWDVVSVTLTFALLICEPWIAAFQPRGMGVGVRQFRRHEAWVVVLDLANITWFSLDILLSMVTTYSTVHGVKVWDQERIVVTYLKRWFVWDLVATVPWERMFAKRLCRERCSRKGSAMTLLHMIPVVRAIRGSKIAKARELAKRCPLEASDVLGMPPAVDHISRFVVGAFFGMHVVACVWFIIGDRGRDQELDKQCYEGFDFEDRGQSSRCTWFQRAGYTRGSTTSGFLYATCLYWAVTTVTTVGYGDISANTVGEKLFTMAVEIAGVAWFASLVSALGADIMDDTGADEVRKRKASLKMFLYNNRFPAPLALAVTSYLNNQFEVEREFDGRDPEVNRLLRTSLNPTLKRAVALHLASRDPTLTRNALFKSPDVQPPSRKRRSSVVAAFGGGGDAAAAASSSPPHHQQIWGRKRAFVADCVLAMKASVSAPFELIIPKLTKSRALHVFVRGRAVAVDQVHLSAVDKAFKYAREGGDDENDDLFCVETGDYFGEEGVLLNAVWAKSLIAALWCEFNLVDVDTLARIFADHPDVATALHAECEARVSRFPSVFTVGPSPPSETTTTTRTTPLAALTEAVVETKPPPTLDHLASQLDHLQTQVALILATMGGGDQHQHHHHHHPPEEAGGAANEEE